MKGDYKDLQDSYSLGLPYPKIKVYDKNSIYADLIKKSYAGEVSELTAITQYTYHQLITSDYIKNTLKGIAIVEMHHLEILGELLIALGENPTFLLRKKNKDLYWSSKFIAKDICLKEILLSDIKSEKEAIKQYRKTANIIDDENIIAIINRIILDEELHIKILSNLYEKEIGK